MFILLLVCSVFNGLYLNCPLYAEQSPQLIEQIEAKHNKLRVIVNQQFKQNYLEDDFFAQYDADINLEHFDYSILSMPFLMNVISIVWVTGERYVVDEMDRELYHSLERVKKVFRKMYPKTSWDGEVRPLKLVDHAFEGYQHESTGDEHDSKTSTHQIPMNETDENPAAHKQELKTPHTKERTALLFSGGLDSTSSVLGQLDKQQLWITAWGHSDLRLTEGALWNARQNKIENFAASLSQQISTQEATSNVSQHPIAISYVRSNYLYGQKINVLNKLTPEIKKWRLGAVEGLGWAGLTAPILLTKGYPTLRIASSHTWLYPYPAAASPYIDNNLKYCGMRVIHDQFDLTRLGKTEFIAQVCKEKALKKPFLKVCTIEKKMDRNCCGCRKCLTTIAELLAIGENHKKYGFPIELREACTRIRTLLQPHALNYYTIACFRDIQKRIQSSIDQAVPIDEVRSLLSINLDTKHAFDITELHKIRWADMHELLPELEIPKSLNGVPIL